MKSFLDVGLEAVKAAEEILLKYFNTTITFERKRDNSPVTISHYVDEAKIN